MATASKAEEVEPKTGVSFPVTLDDGKKLNCVGVKKPSMLGVGIKIYGFGVYADNEKLADLLKSKIGKCPAKPSKEMFQLAIDGDFGMTVKMVIVFSGVAISGVKKNFADSLGASIKKLNGGKKNDELANKILGPASDDTKITTGSVLEISRLPGYVLEAKLLGEVVSKVESELLSRAFIHMYLGESDVVDKEAKEKVLGPVSDDTKITTGSVLEISRLPGYVIEAKLLGEVVSKVESELLSRAFINMYLGESDVVDKEAKEKFGESMLSLF